MIDYLMHSFNAVTKNKCGNLSLDFLIKNKCMTMQIEMTQKECDNQDIKSEI